MLPPNLRRAVLLLLRKLVLLLRLQIGVVEVDMLSSSIWNVPLHLCVMPVLEQVPSNIEGICILAAPFLDLYGGVMRCKAVLTELGAALRPHGVADTVPGDRRLLVVVVMPLLLLPRCLGDLRRRLLHMGRELQTVICLRWGWPRRTLRDPAPP